MDALRLRVVICRNAKKGVTNAVIVVKAATTWCSSYICNSASLCMAAKYQFTQLK